MADRKKNNNNNKKSKPSSSQGKQQQSNKAGAAQQDEAPAPAPASAPLPATLIQQQQQQQPLVLLSDEQVQQFLVNGFIAIKAKSLDEKFHADVYQKTSNIELQEGNPGNNILPRLQELNLVYQDPHVKGAIQSLLGENYTMQPHRFCHLTKPGKQHQMWHKDSFFGFKKTLRHNQLRYVMGMYYPQKVTIQMGPTEVKIGSHLFTIDPKRFTGKLFKQNFANDDESVDRRMVCEAGTVVIIHYDLVHRAGSNDSNINRFMFKFQFNRVEEPLKPSWNCKSTNWDPSTTIAALNIKPTASNQYLNQLKPLCYHIWQWMCGANSTTALAREQINHTAFLALPGMKERLATVTEAELVKQLDSEEEGVRYQAAFSLAMMMNKCKPLIERLKIVADFKDSDRQEMRLNAAMALTATASVDQTLKELISILNAAASSKDRDLTAQYCAAFVCMELGSLATPALPALIGSLKSSAHRVKIYAAEALGTICNVAYLKQAQQQQQVEKIAELTKHRQEAAQALAVVLTAEKDDHVKLTVALTLARIGGTDAACAVPELIKMMQYDNNRYARGNAILALQRIGTVEALQAVVENLMTARWCPITTKKDPF